MCPWGYGKRHEFVDTPCCEEKINALESEIANLESQVQDAKLDGATEVSTPNVNTPNSNVKVTSEITSDTKVVAKSVFMDGASINAKMDVTASENIECVNGKVGGSYPGSTVIMNLKDAEKVVFKDMVFDAADSYNTINIGLAANKQAKEVVFEDCMFLGPIRNNAISVYGTQENAVVTVKNCVFENVSNPFRMCNNANVSNVVVNIKNCEIKSWDANPDYAGLVICQDYTSATEEECISNDLFNKNKLTINVENTIGPNGKNMIDYVKEFGIQNTVVYVWQSKSKVQLINAEEHPEFYPTVNVK